MEKDMRVINIFGKRYFLPLNGNMTETKANILIESTLLFAKNGYSAVSVRDIAESVKITPGAIYNHFASMEALWIEVLNHAELLFKQYFNDLDKYLNEAETFEEALELMFKEPKEMKNVYVCYAFSIVLNEKLYNKQAAKVYSDTFNKYCIDMVTGWFDRFVTEGKVQPFNTELAAIAVSEFLYNAIDAWVLNKKNQELGFDHIVYVSAAEEIVRHLSGSK